MMEMPNAECNTQRKKGSAMFTRWVSQNINTCTSFCTETKMPSWYNDKDRNRPGGNYSALFPLFEEKGGCGRLVFFKKNLERRPRNLGMLSFHYGFNIMHSVEFSV